MSGDDLPEVPIPASCPGCTAEVRSDLVRRSLYVCGCGYHFPLSADAWIALLADAGSWAEHWADLVPADILRWTSPVPYEQALERARALGLNESVRVGSCRLDRRQLWLAVFDFRFMGGTLSVVGGERLVRAMEAAIETARPFVLVTASGGARMQEGLLALMQMPKVNAVLADLLESRSAFVSILTHPTFGGTAASLALLGDVNIAEPGAAIGFTGPRVIKQATHATLPDGFQSAEFQRQHGQIDLIVPRHELRGCLGRLVGLLSVTA
jgi:acetyl-CoA carboxylase carboxyl transferase subunit beta